MRTARSFLLGTLSATAVVFAAACGSDSLTQPDHSLKAPTQSPSMLLGTTGTVTSVKFTINPTADNYIQIGAHLLVIPANSVCDPATSGYGPSTWANPCTTIKKPISVTAKASTMADGHPYVDFDTHLRFKPTSDTSSWVMLYLQDANAGVQSKILWCPITALLCIDETATSTTGTLETHYDNQTYFVYRRIQHFSGYNVTGGRDECDPTDPTCGGSL